MTEFNISRFKNIEKKTYECEVITPMFLAGANQKQAEIRTQSIKGALRFWWRAMYGGSDIADMKKREAEIFGSTEEKSKIVIRATNQQIQTSLEKLAKSGFDTLNYLAYGYDDNQGHIRPHIIPTSKFRIEVSKEINDVVDIFINYGGLGSRSRNGFGSIFSKDVNIVEINQYFQGDLKPFTSFSSESKVFKFGKSLTWQQSLKNLGEIYKNARYEMKIAHKDRGLIGKPFKNDKSRYAKPYFFHISKVGNEFQGQILFLPSVYQNKTAPQERYMEACESLNSILEGGAI